MPNWAVGLNRHALAHQLTPVAGLTGGGRRGVTTSASKPLRIQRESAEVPEIHGGRRPVFFSQNVDGFLGLLLGHIYFDDKDDDVCFLIIVF